jgi:uncharacterized membrane protein YvbJ
MTSCEKCGNTLVIGTVRCVVCGTPFIDKELYYPLLARNIEPGLLEGLKERYTRLKPTKEKNSNG